MDAAYAAQYRDLYRLHWWWRAREAFVLAELRRITRPGGQGRILDVGCGDGLLFPQLEPFGEVEGVEPDAAMRSGLPQPRIHPVPFEQFDPARRYSLILMLDVVEHVPDPLSFLKHGLTLLEPSGMLVLTVPAFPLLWTTHDVLNGHVRRFTRHDLRRMADEAGMRIDRMVFFFHWLFVAKLLVRSYEAIARPRPSPPRLPGLRLNRVWYLLSRAEQAAFGRARLPFGASLLLVGGRASTR